MAQSSSSAAPASLALGFIPVSEKLGRGSYAMWCAQVESAIRGAQLGCFIKATATPPPEFLEPDDKKKVDGKAIDPIPNPEYDEWVAKDQMVLSYLFGSLSKEVFAQVSSATTAAQLWAAIEGVNVSQSRARMISTRMALATASKGSSTIAEYYTKMKGLVEELAAAGRKLEDEEMVSYILTGLDQEYNPLVTAVTARVEPITLGELYSQLVSLEQRMELQSGGPNPSANLATKGGRGGGNKSRGRGGGGRSGGGGGGRGDRVGSGRGNGGRSSFQPGVICQLCGKEGHPVVRCFKRFDRNFTGPPQKSASAATSSYGVDTNWYVDSGATDHITGDLERLTVRDRYHGGEEVHAANGTGMDIVHVGHSIVSTLEKSFHLNNVLHVPKASKNLCFVNRFVRDNDVFIEFHPRHFFIKDQVTKTTLHSGRCEGGLYSLRSTKNKQALGVMKPSASLWHQRLGHPSTRVVQDVISRHKLLVFPDSNKDRVCDACQQGKSHQLPYPKSSSVSSGPLDLVFSDVWGPAPTSVGRKN